MECGDEEQGLLHNPCWSVLSCFGWMFQQGCGYSAVRRPVAECGLRAKRGREMFSGGISVRLIRPYCIPVPRRYEIVSRLKQVEVCQNDADYHVNSTVEFVFEVYPPASDPCPP